MCEDCVAGNGRQRTKAERKVTGSFGMGPRLTGAKALVGCASSCSRTGVDVWWLTVSEESAGQRIDNFLVRILKGVPKSHVYRILRTGEVRVNKGRVGAETRLASGDVVRVPPVRMAKQATTSRPVPKIASK